MEVSTLINGFLSYLVLMAITVGIAILCGFIGLQVKKRNEAKKKAEDEAKRAKR